MIDRIFKTFQAKDEFFTNAINNITKSRSDHPSCAQNIIVHAGLAHAQNICRFSN